MVARCVAVKVYVKRKRKTTHAMSQIIIPDIIEVEIPIKPSHPAAQRIQHLCQGWMNVKVVFSSDVLTRKGTEMDFIEPTNASQYAYIRTRGGDGGGQQMSILVPGNKQGKIE